MRTMILTVLPGVLLLSHSVTAHFQTLLPSTDMVTQDNKTVTLRALFTHPMEQGPLMMMGKPVQFGVLIGGQKHELMNTLEVQKQEGKTFYTTTYTPKQPGDYVFFIEPTPYWEPAENKMIVHYTKVVVDAFSGEDGWDALVGFPIEIEPLVRPYGLWTGNLFRGLVKHNGQPIPFATVEVEYFNEGKKVIPPADPFVTQVIKADANGVFSYAMPKAGWWGFAALIESDAPLPNPDGKAVPVEQGGLMWVHTVDMR